MPYIPDSKRVFIDEHLVPLIRTIRLSSDPLEIVGVLNYCFTRMVMQTLLGGTPIRYGLLALVKGLFSTLESEFERRIVQPYEHNAREKNGDVPEYEAFDDAREDSPWQKP